MREFNECLNYYGLIQAPKSGLEFSWCNNRAGKKRFICNLDREVFNDKWLELYPSWGYKVGIRSISNHGVLYGANADIPKPRNVPFRELKVWKSHPDFLKKIQASWNKMIRGNPIYIFINIVLLNNLVTARGKQEVLVKQQKEINQQKSRVKWLKEGASNSNFFHINMKLRQSQNVIVELEDENGNIVDIPHLVSEEENVFLDAIPSDEEVKRAAFEIDPDSAPGPDGFVGWFYRYAWEIMGNDLTKAIQYCWRCGFIPQGFNANFLLLLPKVNNAKKAGQFRPIGLMNFSFKVITKIISSRFGSLIQRIVSPQQDDIFLFCNGDKRNVKKLAALLKDYQDASGQIFNLAKSKCFIGGTSELRKQKIANECRMLLATFPDKYLGIILTPGRIKSQHVWNCIEKIQASLAGWMGDPAKRKSIVLKWDKVCSPFEEGGLGLRILEIMNKPMLMKLWWKMLNSKEEWARYFQGKFLTKNGEWIGYYKKSSILPGLKWISEDVKNSTRWIVGNGAKISV
ncbi:uncharacterized protein LOC113325041 [Papaver somniferum]|uniref:uncharacterized protein LOC113325041 n=1 Tax=Papaver somniferum TaxID=3469 RepID=UPI000E70248E|nr:uncharacterized protein LOC113325041 [Papaver somniferum]